MNWPPIETAPKDGTKVLVYGNGSYAVAHFDGEEWLDLLPAVTASTNARRRDITWSKNDETK